MFDRKKYRLEYYQRNKEKLLEYHKNYRKENKEKIQEYGQKYGQEYAKNYRVKNRELLREKGRKYYRDNIEKGEKYRENNRERAKQNAKLYREQNKERKNISDAEYKKKYPERIKARHVLNYLIYTGKIIRQPCEVCGNKKSQAHHEDYSKPLEVNWLCASHHKKLHFKITKNPN